MIGGRLRHPSASLRTGPFGFAQDRSLRLRSGQVPSAPLRTGPFGSAQDRSLRLRSGQACESRALSKPVKGVGQECPTHTSIAQGRLFEKREGWGTLVCDDSSKRQRSRTGMSDLHGRRATGTMSLSVLARCFGASRLSLFGLSPRRSATTA
jgi:hypothetical protein